MADGVKAVSGQMKVGFSKTGIWVLMAWLLMAAVSCDSTEDSTEDVSGTAEDTAIVDAVSDAEVLLGADTYISGLEKVGMKGNFTVRLLESNPIPNYTGLYTWRLEVVDTDGESVAGAVVEAEPTMPVHDHGTWPLVTVASEKDSAIYELADMDLFMDGVWNVAIRIVGPDGTEDEVAYDFDLQG